MRPRTVDAARQDQCRVLRRHTRGLGARARWQLNEAGDSEKSECRGGESTPRVRRRSSSACGWVDWSVETWARPHFRLLIYRWRRPAAHFVVRLRLRLGLRRASGICWVQCDARTPTHSSTCTRSRTTHRLQFCKINVHTSTGCTHLIAAPG